MKSKIKVNGFCWKRGMAYIKINKHLTSGIPAHLRKYIPVRKSKQGTEPGMASKTFNRTEGIEDEQWIYSSGQKKRNFFSYAVLECSKQKMSLAKVSRSAQKPRN